jgi:acylphosphatase
MRQARRLGLDGWVRNQIDGSVQVVAEGDKSTLEDMLDWLERGPSSANVTDVDAKYGEYRGQYNGFRIEY